MLFNGKNISGKEIWLLRQTQRKSEQWS